MKALITGASGFVGYSVAKTLIANGFSVKAMIRSGEFPKPLLPLNLEVCQGNLLDEQSLKKALQGCKYLFHVAAHYSLWERDPTIFQRINVDGTTKLLRAAQEMGVEKIVYTSSVATLKLTKTQQAVDETSQATVDDMVGLYKTSKFLAEVEVMKMAKEGIPVTIVSPSAPIGPYDVKPTPTGKIIVDFLKRKMPAYLETGLNVVAVEDVAQGHLLALDKGKIGERYILGGKNLRLIEILKILSDITGLSAPKIRMPYWIAYSAAFCSQSLSHITGKHPEIPLDGVRMAKKYMFFDSSKAVAELGYKITSERDALQRAVEWFQGNGYV